MLHACTMLHATCTGSRNLALALALAPSTNVSLPSTKRSNGTKAVKIKSFGVLRECSSLFFSHSICVARATLSSSYICISYTDMYMYEQCLCICICVSWSWHMFGPSIGIGITYMWSSAVCVPQFAAGPTLFGQHSTLRA